MADKERDVVTFEGAGRRRAAVVTGGAHGIGQAFARRLATDGLDVGIADREDASTTVRMILDEGGRAFAGRCDVADPDSVAEFRDAALGALGAVDVLVLNAGIYPATPFLEMDHSEWERVLHVNLDQAYHLTRAFLPGMVARGWGRIVLVSSTTFHSGIPNHTHYTASKGGVIGFARSLAAEVGEHGVTVNTIAPGLVRTHGTTGHPAEWFDSLAAQQSIKRSAVPQDLAGPLSFLASDDAAFVTGQTLCVDGGWMRS